MTKEKLLNLTKETYRHTKENQQFTKDNYSFTKEISVLPKKKS